MATNSFIQIENLTKSYGDRLLFADVTFGINEGDKIGLIAKNGTGKTTMLRIIAGVESPDSGTITPRSGLRVGILEQHPLFEPGLSALEAATIPDVTPEQTRRMLSQLGVNDFSAPVATLSGGQQKRIAIARLILSEPDLLILDEPTNHLDLAVIEWLENYLSRSRITLLMVTHDRYFLDRVCNKIIEIDRGAIFTYHGNYDYYLRRRAERIEALESELAKVKNVLRRETEWMRRQPQARAGKAKYRIDAYHELRERSRVNYTEHQVDLDVRSSYLGSKIAEAKGISKQFGDKVILRDFSYTFARYEKVGIVGANGVGKSTFIKILLGQLQPDAGRWDVGETVRFGYYSQEGLRLDPGKKVIDAVTDIADDIHLDDGRRLSPMQFLKKFLFEPADQQKFISTLSGGELCRLHLAVVLMRSPNFLVLDEPTNDLDIITLGLLEDYLRDFKGSLIVVSHDRFFLDQLVDHIFVMEGNGSVKDFPGTYSDYKAWLTEKSRQSAADSQSSDTTTFTKKVKTPQKPKMTFKERREFQQLTEEIDALTAEKAHLDVLFASGQELSDVAELAARYSQLSAMLDEKELRWLELSEKE